MEIDPCDVAIAGAGPAGASLALELSSRGFSVSIFEEHASVGSPSHCAGLVGPSVGDPSNLAPLVDRSTINRIKGAVFVSPSGNRFTVEGDVGSAIVLDRKIFDRGLVRAALDRGAKLHLRSKITGMEGKKVKVVGEGESSWFEPKVLVGATGSRFAVARLIGERNGRVIPGIQVEITDLDLDREMVHVYFGNHISQDLFAWVIPLDSRTARVGLCSRTGAKRRLDEFLLNEFCRDFGTGTVVEVNSGAIVYGWRERTVSGRVLLVGDEALQTKPATGGGIQYSVLCSTIACEAISGYLTRGADLAEYDDMWRAELGREIRFGLAVRRLYRSLSNRELDELFGGVSEELSGLLARSNFDRHSTVAELAVGCLPLLIRDLGIGRFITLAGRLLGAYAGGRR
jgi:geranylgeranyl reductase family protein